MNCPLSFTITKTVKYDRVVYIVNTQTLGCVNTNFFDDIDSVKAYLESWKNIEYNYTDITDTLDTYDVLGLFSYDEKDKDQISNFLMSNLQRIKALKDIGDRIFNDYGILRVKVIMTNYNNGDELAVIIPFRDTELSLYVFQEYRNLKIHLTHIEDNNE